MLLYASVFNGTGNIIWMHRHSRSRVIMTDWLPCFYVKVIINFFLWSPLAAYYYLIFVWWDYGDYGQQQKMEFLNINNSLEIIIPLTQYRVKRCFICMHFHLIEFSIDIWTINEWIKNNTNAEVYLFNLIYHYNIHSSVFH